MFCMHCGTKNLDTATYCMNCGRMAYGEITSRTMEVQPVSSTALAAATPVQTPAEVESSPASILEALARSAITPLSASPGTSPAASDKKATSGLLTAHKKSGTNSVHTTVSTPPVIPVQTATPAGPQLTFTGSLLHTEQDKASSTLKTPDKTQIVSPVKAILAETPAETPVAPPARAVPHAIAPVQLSPVSDPHATIPVIEETLTPSEKSAVVEKSGGLKPQFKLPTKSVPAIVDTPRLVLPAPPPAQVIQIQPLPFPLQQKKSKFNPPPLHQSPTLMRYTLLGVLVGMVVLLIISITFVAVALSGRPQVSPVPQASVPALAHLPTPTPDIPTPTPTDAPTPTPTPIPAQSFEAESAANTLSGGATPMPCTNCSGGQKVGDIGNNSGVLQFNNIYKNSAGSYTLTIYACTGETRYALMSVNGGAPIQLTFTSTTPGDFNTPAPLVMMIQLNAGDNTISFSNPNGWAPDFDRITV